MKELHVFILGAFHHILKIQDAIQYFRLVRNSILILDTIPYINKDLDLYLEGIKIISIDLWSLRKPRGSLKKYIKAHKLFQTLKNNYIVISYFFHYSSDYEVLFNRIIQPKRMILLDEGSASLLVSSNYFFKTRFLLIYCLKSIIYLRFFIPPRHFAYFTEHTIIGNNRNEVINYLPSKKRLNGLITVNTAYILGSSISEAGVITEQVYLGLVKKIISKNPDIKYLYFKHRKESASKLTQIQEMGCKIQGYEIPFELYLQKLKYFPEYIMSLFSTVVLFNISRRYDIDSKLQIYFFNEGLLLKQQNEYKILMKQYLSNDKISFSYLDNH